MTLLKSAVILWIGLIGLSAQAADEVKTQLYVQEMRWAEPYEVATNYLDTECPEIKIPMTLEVLHQVQKRRQGCEYEARVEFSSKKICSAQVKKDFDEGRPVPSICLRPTGVASQFKAQKVSSTIDVDNSLIESLNSLAGNASSTENLKNLIRQLIQEEIKKQ